MSINHNYHSIDGWFNMENQYKYLMNNTPDGGIFVELGAWKGKSTSYIVTEIFNNKRNINFYTVDTFLGELGSSDKNEKEAYSKFNLNEIYDIFSKNTNHLKEHFKVIKSLSHDAANEFKDNSVDVIFIDAGHSYESVKLDIEKWYPKMKNNSIMSGHDFNNWPGVKKAVMEFFPEGVNKVENECWFKNINK